jgi:hypothetical protein
MGRPPDSSSKHWHRLKGYYGSILLKKSKVATVRIFGENLKRTGIADSYSRSRVAEVAYEFSVRQRVPSGPYAKTAPKGRRIFDLLYKTTFSTVSVIFGSRRPSLQGPFCPQFQTSPRRLGMSVSCAKSDSDPLPSALRRAAKAAGPYWSCAHVYSRATGQLVLGSPTAASCPRNR